MVKVDAQEHQTTIPENADQAFYYAKLHGRNKICNYHELIETGLLQPGQINNDIELF